MTRHLRWWILTAIVAAPTLGCGHHASSPSEPAATPPDSITIDSISPLPGARLAPGSTVTFGTVLRYAVHENLGGSVIIEIADDRTGTLLGHLFPSASLPQGTGTVTLTSPFQIPSSGTTRITIEYLLVATPGVTSEFVAASKVVSYPVGR
jgi:hypothetical protein